MKTIALFLSLSIVVLGQGISQISGTVQDSSGLAIPGAEVRAIQTDTGVTRTAVSAADGGYLLPSLPIGPYRLEVSKQGFTSYVQSGITLQVATSPTIDVTLKVGAVSEQVQVEASAAMVETQSTGVGQVVDQQRVVDLPLNGRNATELIFLAGAATSAPAADLSSAKNYPGPALVSVAGGASNGMTYLLDGGTFNDPLNNLNLPLPFPDALQEFKVETSSLPAQYGHHSAAAVNAVTKSGGNEIHGNLFEFLRNYHFNARNSFAATRDSLKRNQFGGTLGGPIQKNKLFYFLGYQGNIQRSNPGTSSANIPTPDMLKGDFTGITSPACNAGRQITLKGPFVNNKIAPTLMAGPALKMSSYFPTPPDTLCGLIFFGPLNNQDEHTALYKLDYQINSKHSVLFRHFIAHSLQPSPYNNNNPLTLTLSGADDLVNSAVFGDTYVLSPGAVNSFRATFNRSSVTKFQVPIPDPKALGIKITPNIPDHVRISAGTFQNISVFGYPSTVPTSSYQLADDFNLIRGTHQMGFGFNYIRLMENQYNLLDSSGSFTFGSQNTGLTMGDFFSGQPSSFTQANIGEDHSRNRYFGLYAQDNWRATRKLTISMGLRWEPWMGSVRLHDHLEHFDLDRYKNGVRSQVYPNAPAGLMFPGDAGFESGNKTNVPSWKNFAPRFGMVWDPKGDGRTSIRASWGMFYDLPHALFFYPYAVAAPWGNKVTLTNPAPNGFADPWASYPGGDPFPSRVSKDFKFPSQGAYVTNDFHLKTTYLEQWNLSIQHQFGRDWLASVSYLGNNTIHLWTNTDLNPAVYLGTGACNINGTNFATCSTTANYAQRRVLSLLNPTQGAFYTSLPRLDDGGTGNYNGLLTSLNRRLAKGVTINANYTWSHCISDLATTEFRNGLYQNPSNRRYDRSNCAGTDRRHLFNLSAVAATPKFSNALMRHVASDWRVSTIYRAQSGPYLTISSGVDTALTNLGNTRADLVSATPLAANPTINQYFNPQAFATPANGSLGNLGSNNIRGRGTFNFDMSLARIFAITEHQKVEFRAEGFQILNHPILGQPSTSISGTTFGRTTASTGERIMQFALKYSF